MVASPADIEKRIEDFVRRIEASIRVEVIVLFGSYAKGTANEWSDIDVAVVSPDFNGMRKWDRQELIARSSLGRAYRISPVGLSTEEYQNPDRSFVREIKRTGKIVYPRFDDER